MSRSDKGGLIFVDVAPLKMRRYENGDQEPKKLIDILINSLSNYDSDDDITLVILEKT